MGGLAILDFELRILDRKTDAARGIAAHAS